MKNLKSKSLLTILLVLAILVSSASMAFASLETFLVKADDGRYYEYNSGELNNSYLAYQINPDAAGAAMYKQFVEMGAEVVALGDSEKGWMDFQAAQTASVLAQIAGTPFDVNEFMAGAEAPVYAETVTDPVVVDPAGETHDLKAYNEAVALAATKVEADYTADSWSALQTALTDNVVTAADAQADIDAAAAAINTAISALVEKPKVDLAAYDAALAAANALVEADYTAASWTNLQTVKADNVMTVANTQAEIDAATAAINDAVDALVFAGQAALDTAKAAAATKVEADYTAASFAPLTAALALPETTNAEVVAKTTAINDAVAGLVFAGKADLDAAKADAAAIVAADYTADTYAAVTAALALPETTNAEIVAKTTAINNAIDGLVEIVKVTALTAVNNNDETVTVSGTTNRGTSVNVTVGTAAPVAVPVTAGAFSYTTGILAPAVYPVSVTAVVGAETSAAVTAEVTVVAVAPTVVSATAVNNTTANVVFSEKVDEATAEAAVNYTANNGLNITAAVLQADGKTVKLTTSAQFAVTTYTVTVTGVKDLAGNVIGAGNTATFQGSEAPVVVAVLDNSSADIATAGFTSLANAASITADFNVAMGAVTTQTVKLYNLTDSVYVAGTPAIVAGNVKFTPAAGQIVVNKKYQLEIASTVQSENGVALGQDYKFAFIVGTAPAAPTLTPLDLAPTVAVADSMTAKFNQDMDASTFTNESVKLEKLDALGNVVATIEGTISYDSTMRKVTFDPTNALEGLTKYKFTVAKDLVKNTVGIALQADAVSEFTTATSENLSVDKVEFYEGAAFVEKTTGDTGIDVTGNAGSANADVKITLDAGVKASTVSTDNVLLYNKATGVYETITLAPVNDNDTSFTFGYGAAAATKLDYNTEYELTLSGLTDNSANLNPLPTYKFTFTTETGEPVIQQVFSDVNGGGAYTAGDLLVTEGITNVDETKDLFVQFESNIAAIVQNTDVKLYNMTDSTYVTLANTAAATKYIKIGNADLAGDKQYKLIVEKTVKDAVTNVGLTTKFERTFTTVGTTASTSAANIKYTDVADASIALGNANKAALDTAVTVTFDKEILASSITADTVKLVKVADGTAVTATRTLNAAKKVITITPSADLQESTAYTVVVTNGLKDTFGNTVTPFSDLTKSFMTEAQITYTANIVNAATDVVPGTKVVFTFNRAMNAATLTGSTDGTFAVTQAGKAVALQVWDTATNNWKAAQVDISALMVYDVNAKTMTINFATVQDNKYRVVFNHNVIADTLGNKVLFDSAAATQVLEFTVAKDTTAPVLESATVGTGATLRDLNGAKAVDKTAGDIVLTFDKEITAATAIPSNITIINKDTQAVVNTAGATASVITGAPAKVLTVDLNETAGATTTALANDTNYRLVITGLKDAAGNTAADVDVSFLTGPAPTIGDEGTGTIAASDTNVDVSIENTIKIEDATASEVLTTVSASNVVFKANNAVVNLGHTVTMAPDGTFATITIPADKLAQGTTYTMEVTGVTDIAGNPMANTDGKYTMTFTTEPVAGQIVASQVTFKANGVALADQGQIATANKANVQFIFPASTNFTGIATVSKVRVENLTDAVDVPLLQGMVTAINGGKDIQIAPNGGFVSGKIYRVTISSGLKDANNVEIMENLVVTFDVE